LVFSYVLRVMQYARVCASRLIKIIIQTDENKYMFRSYIWKKNLSLILRLVVGLNAAVVITRLFLSLGGDVGGDKGGYFSELTLLRRFLDVDVRFFGYVRSVGRVGSVRRRVYLGSMIHHVVMVYRDSVGKKGDCTQVYTYIYEETVYTHSYSKYGRKLIADKRMVRELSVIDATAIWNLEKIW